VRRRAVAFAAFGRACTAAPDPESDFTGSDVIVDRVMVVVVGDFVVVCALA
jgi:hypothetical protein